MPKKTIASLSAVSAIALSVTSPVWAQQPAEAEDELDEILVTGSRIASPGFEAPTPLTTVSTEELQRKAPGALADGLNQLPQFQNSITTSARSTGTGGAQNTGNYLNMRALGTNRVLVLQDGQRMATTGNNGGVDVSLIPSMLIEKVDVVTGGASAVYGSDAVSGVVNFVLNKRMEGLRVQAQMGTGSGDVSELNSYRFGAAGGMSLMDDRLHIVGSAESYHTDPLNRRYFPIMARRVDAQWQRRDRRNSVPPHQWYSVAHAVERGHRHQRPIRRPAVQYERRSRAVQSGHANEHRGREHRGRRRLFRPGARHHRIVADDEPVVHPARV